MIRPERCCRNRMLACLTTLNVPFQVDRYHIVPLFFGHVEYHPVSQNAGAGDHNVQLAIIVYGRLNDGLAATHGSDGFHASHCRSVRFGYLIDHLLGEGLVHPSAIDVHAQVNHHHLGSFRGHQHGDAPADATARTSYDRYFVLQ